MDMWLIITIAALGGVAIGATLFVLFKKINAPKQHDSFQLLLQQMNELTRTVDQKIGTSHREMHESLKYQTSQSIKAIRDVTERLTKLDETNRQVVSFADQLKNLQDILKNPKQRGILGEYYLETTLKNVLPPNSFQMQYRFDDGETIVDAVVFVRDKIIPIDSKFSLENYNKILEAQSKTDKEQYERLFKNDLKTRIDETAKYIRPTEGTMDFAFMYIPHESIYYDLLVSEIGGMKSSTQDLIEYAFKKNVLIVSPTSFLAFLQTVLQGLRSLQIEESAKEIQKRVGQLATHLQAYETYHQKLGKNLQTVVNQYDQSSGELKKIDKDVTKITGQSIDFEALPVEKPDVE